MQQLDSYSHLSEEDGGPFLEAATLYRTDDDQLLLKVEAGYQKPYDTAWYSLSNRPSRNLETAFRDDVLGCNPLEDQSAELTDTLQAVCHRVERD